MFQTQNYTIIWCEKCQDRTIIEPGKSFDKLNCKCQVKEEDARAEPRTDHQAKRTRQKQ